MSRTTIMLAAALGCVVLFAIWVQTGEETTPLLDERGENVRSLPASKPGFPKSRRPRSLLDRSERRPDVEEQADGEGGDMVAHNDVQPRAGSMEELRAMRKGRRDARLQAKRAQQQEGGKLAGVVPRGQLSRRAPESEGMVKAEQPPLRQPLDDTYDEEGLDHLRDVALGDPDPDERADAVSQLDLDDPEAMDVLIKALEDRDTDVRLAALDELWTNSDEPPLDILERVVNDPDPEVRLEAVRILSESDEPFAQQLLRGALTDRDEDVRDEAADALDVD